MKWLLANWFRLLGLLENEVIEFLIHLLRRPTLFELDLVLGFDEAIAVFGMIEHFLDILVKGNRSLVRVMNFVHLLLQLIVYLILKLILQFQFLRPSIIVPEFGKRDPPFSKRRFLLLVLLLILLLFLFILILFVDLFFNGIDKSLLLHGRGGAVRDPLNATLSFQRFIHCGRCLIHLPWDI